MPKGSEILDAQIQGDTLCLWAIVNPIEEEEDRKIHIVGTGNLFPEIECCYLGTVQDGNFVWHVFEEI
jgi:hypothetical protein